MLRIRTRIMYPKHLLYIRLSAVNKQLPLISVRRIGWVKKAHFDNIMKVAGFTRTGSVFKRIGAASDIIYLDPIVLFTCENKTIYHRCYPFQQGKRSGIGNFAILVRETMQIL